MTDLCKGQLVFKASTLLSSAYDFTFAKCMQLWPASACKFIAELHPTSSACVCYSIWLEMLEKVKPTQPRKGRYFGYISRNTSDKQRLFTQLHILLYQRICISTEAVYFIEIKKMECICSWTENVFVKSN